MTTTTAPRTYRATLTNGEVITRTTRSARLFYTHVRIVHFTDGTLVATWHTSADLAANGRSDNDPQRRCRWSVVPVEQVAGEGATPAPAPVAELGPIARADLTSAQYLGTIGRGRAVHLVLDHDTRNTACDARAARNAVGVVYDRDAVVTCTRCTKAHRARG